MGSATSKSGERMRGRGRRKKVLCTPPWPRPAARSSLALGGYRPHWRGMTTGFRPGLACRSIIWNT